MTELADLGEFGLIAHLAKRASNPRDDVRVGIGDDTAVLIQKAGEELLMTTDAMVEGVHFRLDTLSPWDIGWKSVAVSISDIAAMGGEPKYVTMSLALPETTQVESLEAMYDGIAAVCAKFKCALVGGDVVKTTGPMVLTSTVVGAAPEGTALLRSGAQVGDVIFVTGTVGGSGAGLAYLLRNPAIPEDEGMQLRKFHQQPMPQVVAGQILRLVGATSCDDISDGLASELNELASASAVRLRVDAERIPISPVVRNFARACGEQALDYALYGGEDYQLVGTASTFAFAGALARCESVGISLTQIGRVERGDGVIANVNGQLQVVKPRGFNHFRKASQNAIE